MEKCDSPALDGQPAPRGLIDPRGAAQRVRVRRYVPSARLRPFVDHHWIIQWDLTGSAEELQRVIPSPNAHLVISPGESALFGVVRGLEERWLRGRGIAYGMRFRPGGLRPFLNHPMAVLTDRKLPAETLTGCGAPVLEARILTQDSHKAMIREAEACLEPRLPAPDDTVDRVCSIIAALRQDGGATRAATLARAFGMTPRSLERLFYEYVGVSPKWVIQRYRLQDAAYLLASDSRIQLAALAADLGYFDQAHLTRDFRRQFGLSPAQYRQSQVSV